MPRALACFAACCALLAASQPAQASPRPRAVAKLVNRAGKSVGIANLQAMRRGVLIEFNFLNLPPGAHAIHIHTSGNCDPKSAFTSAGPVWNPVPGKIHGYLAEHGPLAGDLPNQFAGADGRLHASIFTTAFSLGNAKRSLFDRDGAALIVDQRGDDYGTPPLGNAGERIACGVIIRTVGPAARRKPPARK